MLVYEKGEYFVMQMLYDCVLCASCISVECLECSFPIILTINGSTVFRCLVYSVSFICLSEVALVVIG